MDRRNECIPHELGLELGEKLWAPNFPHNLTETEWRRYVFAKLEGLNDGFAKRLLDVVLRVEKITGTRL